MTKVKLRFAGDQQPKGIVEVDSKKVESLLARGDYFRMDEHIYNIEDVSKKKKKSEEKSETKIKEDKEVI